MTFFRRLLSAFLSFFRRRGKPRERARDLSRSAVQLKRWNGDDRPPPLMWKDCHPRTQAIFKAELTCSNGHSISLRGHSISLEGHVTPSVVCQASGCDFHDYVRLAGWTAGAL
ncbi:hypothetical protein RPD_0029 [Rhodopseudomonas palustris BisB5]|uniref:Uncharacterized protein n=1 Tax=Rhodopseudomonas palustris (strain BisB5) TaxID=316057 RepID=Q13F70_RHOPS|nr:hypothetical protein RPD_0029 [Rhodopseudomonas palustris BisB5]